MFFVVGLDSRMTIVESWCIGVGKEGFLQILGFECFINER